MPLGTSANCTQYSWVLPDMWARFGSQERMAEWCLLWFTETIWAAFAARQKLQWEHCEGLLPARINFLRCFWEWLSAIRLCYRREDFSWDCCAHKAQAPSDYTGICICWFSFIAKPICKAWIWCCSSTQWVTFAPEHIRGAGKGNAVLMGWESALQM